MKIAVLMLACSDYEALELSLACHGKYMPKDTPFFILQNCRGSYDAERTLQVARRFQQQYPKNVFIVDHIRPGPPYHSILKLLKESTFKDIDYICKVDDDAFPLSYNWLEKLQDVYVSSSKNLNIAYSTPLINNNTWGFSEVIDVMDLKQEYVSIFGREHRVGSASLDSPFKIIAATDIFTGACGTIWSNPHIARWIHSKTTMAPEAFLNATEGLKEKIIPYQDRYSIGCIFFKKQLWSDIYDGGTDDEHMLHQYCRTKKAHPVCARSVPFVHMAYFSQRSENRDIVESVKKIYDKWLALPWPIGLHATRELEIEERLRWLEGRGHFLNGASGKSNLLLSLFKRAVQKSIKEFIKDNVRK
jgi:hypothetical protein